MSLMNSIYLSKKRYNELYKDGPKVSVVIPARNEEHNILNLLRSLENQTYQNYEVWIIDDCSTDKTWELVQDFIKDKDNFFAIQGDPNFRKGKNGKTGALIQLIPHATGEILIATDADTIHQKDSIAYGVSVLLDQGLDMVSGFPKVNIPSFMGELAVGSMNILAAMYMPLPIIKRKPAIVFTAANGQFLVMKKEALKDVGGYEAIKDEILDDVMLSRLFIIKGKKYQQHRVSHLVTCNMYDNFKDSYRGISRMIAGIFPHKPWMFFPLILFAFIFLSLISAPIVTLLYFILSWPLDIYFAMLTGGWLLFTCGWFRISRLQNFSIGVSLLWPVTIVLTIFMYLNSFFRKLFKRKIEWKGRDVNPNT